MSRKLGFSFIELMACVAIMAALASASVPAFSYWHNKQNFAAIVNQIFGAFQQAKALSIHRHQDYWLGWNSTCFWLAETPSSGCAQQVFEMTEKLQVSSNFSQGNLVQFTQGRGMAAFSSGTLKLKHNAFSNDEIHIVISSLGRVRMCQTGQLFAAVEHC